MPINLTPTTALRLITATTEDRLDEAFRILNDVAVQRVINDDSSKNDLHSSTVRVNLQDAEAVAEAVRACHLYAGLKLEWPGRG